MITLQLAAHLKGNFTGLKHAPHGSRIALNFPLPSLILKCLSVLPDDVIWSFFSSDDDLVARKMETKII